MERRTIIYQIARLQDREVWWWWLVDTIGVALWPGGFSFTLNLNCDLSLLHISGPM